MDVIVSLGNAGSIRGAKDENGVCRFLGVPYAQPPTGQRRWKKPEPLPSDFTYTVNGGPRDGTKFGDICAQEKYVIDGVVFNDVAGGTVRPHMQKIDEFVKEEHANIPIYSIPKIAYLSTFGLRRISLSLVRPGRFLLSSMADGCRLEVLPWRRSSIQTSS